jgi:hypothetical protein
MSDMNELTKTRLVHNEVLFRSINDHVLAVEEQYGSRHGGFLCECADVKCSQFVVLHLDEYQRIHADSRRFFVVPGHERTEVQTVVERHPGYLVVEMSIAVPSLDEPYE